MKHKTLIIFKLRHRNKSWIGIKNFVPLNSWNTIKSLSISTYSKSYKCWYIPYTKEAFRTFKQLKISYVSLFKTGTIGQLSPNDVPTGIGVEPPNSVIPPKRKKNKDADIIGKTTNEEIKIRWSNQFFYLKMPYKKEDVAYVKSLTSSYWDSDQVHWVIKSTIINTKRLQEYFGLWSEKEYDKLILLLSTAEKPKLVTFFISPEYQKKLLVKIEGFGASVSRIKKEPDRKYDNYYKKWILPWSKKTYDQLKLYYHEMGYKVIDRVPQAAKVYEAELRTHKDKLQYLHNKYPSWYRGKIINFSQMMVRQRYSWKSITTYTGKVARYIEFYKGQDIDELTANEANNYLSHISKMEISNSLLNITLSAIKLYYEKIVHDSTFRLDRLERPRKHRSLPTILSIREVDAMLKSISNLKHLSLLYVIYGGGLRLAEVLNLRVQDILWDRNQIHIRSGKGNKDRMVMLSQTLKELMHRYFNDYKPQYWLFEGADKKSRYSSSSVQKMVKTAAIKAGITRKVTPHTLRHCFATHLMDHGTDTRYIQELLGHKDIRTTLIYTHVTTSSIKRIESPLDKIRKEGDGSKKWNG